MKYDSFCRYGLVVIEAAIHNSCHYRFICHSVVYHRKLTWSNNQLKYLQFSVARLINWSTSRCSSIILSHYGISGSTIIPVGNKCWWLFSPQCNLSVQDSWCFTNVVKTRNQTKTVHGIQCRPPETDLWSLLQYLTIDASLASPFFLTEPGASVASLALPGVLSCLYHRWNKVVVKSFWKSMYVYIV